MTVVQDRAFIAAIVESSGDAIIGKTLDGIIVSWNAGAERLYGCSAGEAIGRPISFLIPPDRLGELPDILERVRRGERIENFETERRRKEGGTVCVSLTIAPVRDGERIIGAAAIARDVTSTTSERTEIDRQRQQLVVSQRVARVGSWEWDLATGTVTWSDETYRLYGADPQTFTPSFEGFLAAVHPDDRAAVQRTVTAALEGRHSFVVEHRIRRPDGSVRVMAARGDVALGADLTVVRTYGTTQDITEQRVLEDEMRRQQETLQLRALATNDAV